VDQIQSWVITNVIKAGITWLIGLLNPASAFIKACKAIYDILQFIWTRGKQILEFVGAVVDSVAEIAAGSLGKAAQKVEEALARAIPVTIGFLAGLLGLGDIAETIKAIIAKIREPVFKAVKWIITKAVALVKAAGKLLGFGKDDKEKGEHSDDPEKEAKIAAALAELDARDAEADTGEGVDREQAEAIASATQTSHPVLSSVTVVETPERFNYIWTASKPRSKRGPKNRKLAQQKRIKKSQKEGAQREKIVQKDLADEYAKRGAVEGVEYKIVAQRYLREGKKGAIVEDPVSGEGRKVDFVILKVGKGGKTGPVKSIEVTSPQEDKTAQLEKETRIRKAGGTYIREPGSKGTEALHDISKIETEVYRVDLKTKTVEKDTEW